MASGRNRDGSILFLSCDLQNSTQFKQKSGNRDWITTFLAFYTEFPRRLSELIESDFPSLRNRLQLWKAIGDELIFSILIESERECSDAVDVWLQGMLAFETEHLIGKTPMTLKGGAFVATVPLPDRRVAIPRAADRPDRSQLDAEAVNEKTLNTPMDEGEFAARFAMDFVGPSIDTGFRVLRYASRRYFVLTVEVAHILFKHYSDEKNGGGEEMDHRRAYLVGTHELRGVWDGKPYPVFAIARDLNEEVPAEKLAAAFGNTGRIADEHPYCEPHDALAAVEAYRGQKEWRGAVFLANSASPEFTNHPAASDARRRLDELIDTSEDPVVQSADPGDEDFPADMPTQ